MSGKWIAALLVIVAAGVVVFLIVKGSGEGLPGMSDDNVVGWTWSGEMTRGASGSWIPFKK